jgi:predicted AAA+ superfamily ATPase
MSERYNPWWFGEEDPAYIEWMNSAVKWRPREIDLLSLTPFSLNFLVGPRQAGKTTLVKLVIHELLGKISGKAVFYFSCDELTDHVELGEVLDAYLDSKKAWNVSTAYIFLDEVTFVDDWWRAVKSRVDDGSFRRDAVVVTGSASIELLRGRESFPGRRGGGVDIELMPLSFSSFVEAVEGLKPVRAGNIKKAAEAVNANKVFSRRLTKLFGDYLDSGGFPAAVKEYAARAKVSEATRRSVLDWLRVDWSKVGRSDSYMKEVVGFLLRARCAPVSWLGVAKNTSIGSPNTAEAYVGTLEDLLVAQTLRLVDPTGRVQHRKNRKIHFRDPLLYHVFSAFSSSPVDQPCLVEATVASHIGRRSQAYYWRNAGEADIVVVQDNKQLGLEVKWGYHPSTKPRHLADYITLNKESVPIFLASLDA